MKAELVYASKDILGEGPVWIPEEQALYWVDILKPALHRWHPGSGATNSWEMPMDIGCFALRQEGGAVLGLRSGFAFLDLDSGEVQPIHDPETDQPFTRFNDGKADRQGRFWAGTIDEETQKRRGALYRLDTSGEIQKMVSDIGVSNGLGWSPDNHRMYYTDSAQRTIWVYEYNPERGEISNRQVFATTPHAYVPDGLTVDSAGYVWSAKWDGWKVVRYSPDGSVDREVEVPVQRPTSCMFGGPDLRSLFITSARIGLSEGELENQPEAGGIFVVDTAVEGLPEPRFHG